MDFTLTQMWAQMGVIAKVVVIVLGIMSIYVIGVAAERMIVFAKAKSQSRKYAQLIRGLLEKKDYKAAAEAASGFEGSHIARIIKAGLGEYVRSEGKTGYDVMDAVNRAIDKTSDRQMALLRRGLGGLATVGSTSPFVGLFGTVFGIINSFQGMAREGGGGLGAVAGGIAEALITTAVGIGVAIVAVMVYNYFTSKVESLAVDTRESATEVLDLLIKQSAKAA
ncbi:MAG TPA: MotA/TolQ/ExbB proton channel family protein [Myxococcota bacterium]|nr:MotA/TolQ/ExbB proton channel family protein [Myxococcota bacterium]HRY92090.1 MotA/TolQ/ExbB proton channel family protein [Myxococcota bacterium]HSA22148.1 MotA/TolQ/ExbB proton channel family protein [Myxococcota bacterium]